MEQSQKSEGAPHFDARAVKPWQTRHDVHFYDDESQLASSVGDFLAEGVKSAQPAIVIATAPHVRAFTEALRRRGVDPDALGPNQMVWLDAYDTLSAFMEGGRPNPELFQATVGSVFDRVTNARRYVTVRAFGEMVDILWRDGKSQAALELEELWNGLATRYAFALLCAYSSQTLSVGDEKGFERICSVHTHVMPRRKEA